MFLPPNKFTSSICISSEVVEKRVEIKEETLVIACGETFELSTEFGYIFSCCDIKYLYLIIQLSLSVKFLRHYYTS